MIVGAEKNGVKEGLLGPKPSFSKSYQSRVRKNIGLSLKFWKEDLKDIKINLQLSNKNLQESKDKEIPGAEQQTGAKEKFAEKT